MLKFLTGNVLFNWCSLRAKGSVGGILVGANVDLFMMTSGDVLDYSISVMLTNKIFGFVFKLVVVYGSPCEDSKHAFIDQLHSVMCSWQGPVMLGGDFNLVRNPADKSNSLVNFKWVDLFNDWISKWGIIELELRNRRYTTWTNNQENLVMARIDRVLFLLVGILLSHG